MSMSVQEQCFYTLETRRMKKRNFSIMVLGFSPARAKKKITQSERLIRIRRKTFLVHRLCCIVYGIEVEGDHTLPKRGSLLTTLYNISGLEDMIRYEHLRQGRMYSVRMKSDDLFVHTKEIGKVLSKRTINCQLDALYRQGIFKKNFQFDD